MHKWPIFNFFGLLYPHPLADRG